MVELARQIEAIRLRAAMNEARHVLVRRISGPGAFEAVDHLCATELLLADGRMRPSLLLRPDGRVFADLFVCRDGEDFLLLIEGPTPAELDAFVRAEGPVGAGFTVDDLSATHDLLSLHGPFAGELVGVVVGEDVVALPYLSLFHCDDVICLRGGKTGEYGYDFLVPKERTHMVRARMLEGGAALELVEACVEALDHCALENFVFNARREGAFGLTPAELQLQWRVGAHKTSVGLAASRAMGTLERVTFLVGSEAMASGDQVELDGRVVGRVLVAEPSWSCGGWVGIALLDRSVAHPGLRMRLAGSPKARVVDTASPPVVNNRSLWVDHRRHSWAKNGRDDWPPLQVPRGSPA